MKKGIFTKLDTVLNFTLEQTLRWNNPFNGAFRLQRTKTVYCKFDNANGMEKTVEKKTAESIGTNHIEKNQLIKDLRLLNSLLQ